MKYFLRLRSNGKEKRAIFCNFRQPPSTAHILSSDRERMWPEAHCHVRDFRAILTMWQVCVWRPTVSYCGFRLSGSGYTVDDHLVKALIYFLVPVNRKDIRSFCGLVQQFQSFSPRLTELLAPIRELFSPKSEFTWEAPQQEAFE